MNISKNNNVDRSIYSAATLDKQIADVRKKKFLFLPDIEGRKKELKEKLGKQGEPDEELKKRLSIKRVKRIS